jgi:hypothetical protein
MPYGYNSQGQLVWTDDATPQGGTAVSDENAKGGTFIPQTALPGDPGYRKPVEAGGGMESILGPAPSGKHWMSDGTLANDSVWTKIDNAVMSPTGFAAGILGAAALPAIAALPGLELRGLMTVGRVVDTAEDARPTFAALREVSERLSAAEPRLGRGLSMGMSDDFNVAIEEGATVVRVGRALFGDRMLVAR